MENKLLRIAIAGSVNEGKSSFVGRLLYETGNLYEDQLDEVERLSRESLFRGSDYDFSLFTDGLEFEQKNSITVDVAYRYMNLDGRKVIIADCPGHFEYNKNMVTACSRVHVLMVVLDAQLVLDQQKISEQALRHLHIAETLSVPRIAIVITKMDLFPDAMDATEKIKKIFSRYWKGTSKISFLECSAFTGYGFPAVLQFLSNVDVVESQDVFDVLELQQEMSNKIVLCRAFNGQYITDQEMWLYPSLIPFHAKKIFYNFQETQNLKVPPGRTLEIALAYANDTLIIKNQIAVVNPKHWTSKSRFACHLMWFSEKKLTQTSRLFVKVGSLEFDLAKLQVTKKFSLASGQYEPYFEVEINQTLDCEIEVIGDIPFFTSPDYTISNKFILIDRDNCETVAFGMTT